MAETRLVRLKRGEAKRGYVLQRFTYKGLKFMAERGWYRVSKEAADYLETVHQIPGDEHSRKAFDVCTDAEAKAMDERESKEDRPALATEAIPLASPREEGAGKPRRGGARRAGSGGRAPKS